MRALILGRVLRNAGRKSHKLSIYRSWRSIFRFSAVLFSMSAVMLGCQYADLAGPVEEPAREVAGPGVCTFPVEARAGYDPADSSETCWDGERPHLVALQYPRMRGKDCAETTYMPDGRTVRKFGCPKRPVGDPI